MLRLIPCYFLALALIPLNKYADGYNHRLALPRITIKSVNLMHKSQHILSSKSTNIISNTALQNTLQLNNALESIREQLSIPSENICKMVEKSPSYRLTIKEGASLSGLSLYETRQGLMTLSTLTGGDLEVTNEGEIIYSFPRNFRSILNQRSAGQQIKNINNFLLPKLYYLVRISVGLALFTSIAIAFSTIFVIINSSNSNDDDRRSSSRRGYSSSPSLYINVNDILYLLNNNNNRNYNNGNRNQEVSFLESFFSFLFGDGNPNVEFDIFQAQQVAKLIQLRQGVVTAEELATVLDCPYDPTQGSDGSSGSTSSGIIVNESWVLPALIRFNGEPIVDSDGNIVYKFEDLVADSWMNRNSQQQPQQPWPQSYESISKYRPQILQEEIIPFSRASEQNLVFAKGLGVLNVFGVFALKDLLFSPAALIRQQTMPFLATVAQIYPALVLYALSYFAIPTVRYFLNERKNKQIKLRNERRQKWLDLTNNQNSYAFQKKFNSACKVAFEMAEAKKQSGTNISGSGTSSGEQGKEKKNIIYSTKEPLINQQ